MLENVFSWSKSRDEEFRDCQRKYYYGRYASWGGWDAHASKEARLAYILKNLKNRWAWKGEAVHHIIEDILKSARSGKPVPLETALFRLTETMRGDYRSSKAKKNHLDPKRNVGLFEHEYEKGISDTIWKKIHQESEDCLKNFYNSALYAELLGGDPADWLVIEDLEEFNYDGAKIYVKLDFARKKDGKIEIYDWKTGKPGADDDKSGGHAIQIGTYVIYAMQKWKVPLSDIRAFLVYLGEASPLPREEKVRATLVEDTKKIMTESIQGMRALLANPEKNVPLSRENFQFTENTRLCDFCSYYKICEKYNKS